MKQIKFEIMTKEFLTQKLNKGIKDNSEDSDEQAENLGKRRK